MWSLPKARIAIIAGGCLGMVYTQLTMSPATIAFAREHGASGLHIGMLGALPVATLFMQFLAALVVNHLRYRRWLWFGVSVVQRLAYVPIALGPFLWPEASPLVWLWTLIAATALNHGLLHFATPMWMSWMGDYLPREGLNRFWGVRHVWQQWGDAAALLAAALVFSMQGWTIEFAFAVLTLSAAALGVLDILLFLRIEEPPVKPLPQPTLRRVLAAPFTDRQFRSFISYTCFWHVAAMVGAPFISLFLLDWVGMGLDQLLVLWACSWAGGALLSGWLGRVVESYGHRPMLVLCTLFKSVNMIALMLIPPDPTIAFWVLAPVFMFDALLNAGIAIASNGFLLKNSPRENRTMFIAAGTALAGVCGGAAAIAAGACLNGVRADYADAEWSLLASGYHVLFAVSIVLRTATVPLARRVQEPAASGVRQVLVQLIGASPLRILRFPLGLYRGLDAEDENRHTAPNAAENAALETSPKVTAPLETGTSPAPPLRKAA